MVSSRNSNGMVIFFLACVIASFLGPVLFYVIALNTPTSPTSIALILIFSTMNTLGFHIFGFISSFILPLFIILILSFEYGDKRNRIRISQILTIMSASIILFFLVLMSIALIPFWDVWGIPAGVTLIYSFFIIAIILLIATNLFLSKQEI